MSKSNFFKSALSYEGKVLSYYKRQQETQSALLFIIKSALPEHLVSHALYCVLSERKILLYTNSAIWSSQLRFYHQQICHKLAMSGQKHFDVLQIKIIPAVQGKKVLPVNIPSTKNINFILNEAENQADKDLKKAFFKLAKRLQLIAKK